MPYDTMDKFVALSKCLSGLHPDRVVDDHRYIKLADTIMRHMYQLLDQMEPKQDAGNSAAEHVAQHGGVVAAPGVQVTQIPKRLQVLPEIRDALFKQLRIVQDQFPRGVTFADVHPKYIGTLDQLAGLAREMADVLKRYQEETSCPTTR